MILGILEAQDIRRGFDNIYQITQVERASSPGPRNSASKANHILVTCDFVQTARRIQIWSKWKIEAAGKQHC